ncbi:hypothetical protein [Loigolactobacillus coryniformis]|nr:hypothetical protein [Loigolactobacillus coryniformis]
MQKAQIALMLRALTIPVTKTIPQETQRGENRQVKTRQAEKVALCHTF